MALTDGAIVLAVVIILLVAVLIFLAIQGYNEYRQNQATPVSPGLPVCGTGVDISSLIQLPAGGTACQQGTFYLSASDLIVASYATPIQAVCVQLCDTFVANASGTGGTCTGAPYQGVDAQTAYNTCLANLTDTTCVGASPLAAQGTILYYPLQPALGGCPPPPMAAEV